MSSGYTFLFQIYIVFISVVVIVNIIAYFINVFMRLRLRRLGYDSARRRS